MSRSDTVSARTPALLRLAHQLVGDPAAAAELVARVVSHRRMRRALAGADDERVVVALVRAALRTRTPASDGSRLSELPRRERVAVVLAFALGWDPTGIAEATRSTPRRVQTDVRRGLALASAQEWRALLADDRWDVTTGPDLERRTRLVLRARHSRSRLRGLALAAALTLAVGAIDATVRVVTAPAPLPPTAHGHGLLSWTPRGGLVRDKPFLMAAASIWRRSGHPPAGHVFVLYAGRIGDGRLAVLQAVGRDGRALAAVVADHDVTFRHPRLELDLVAPIVSGDVPVLTIPYDGNLGIPGLTTGPGSRVLQALVAPGFDSADERSVRTPQAAFVGHAFVPSARPGFRELTLHDGISDPWLDLSGPLPYTAVRVYHHGQVAFTGLVDPHGVQPRPMRSRLAPAPAQWSGLPHDLQAETVDDDVLWWAETCRGLDPTVSLVWSGGVRAVSTVVRMELVRCGSRPLTARWVKGDTDGAEWVGENVGAADAYGAVVPPDSQAPGTLVVVGSTAVHALVIGDVRTAARVARADVVAGLPAVVAHTSAGGRLPVLVSAFDAAAP
ncbi:MAG TPA: hypothetical protein VFH66_13200 [Mycobacteriales bacterium]|nr:hypothetical protein [Mycobacteriales bacterium]